MDATELMYDVFQLLYEKHVENAETPGLFVGVQGDKIVVMQPDGAHYAILVQPAMVRAPA